jgi:hypothetical protein
MARKPLVGTVAGNVLAHGTGALNVDGCRIEGTRDRSVNHATARSSAGSGRTHNWQEMTLGQNLRRLSHGPGGRWPANVLLDPEAAAMLDEQTGTDGVSRGQRNGQNGANRAIGAQPDASTANARRVPLLLLREGQHPRTQAPTRAARPGSSTARRPAPANARRTPTTAQRHPTVKPIELMRWLVRLVTPPAGTVLDPFTGSGTTGCAAASRASTSSASNAKPNTRRSPVPGSLTGHPSSDSWT